jgi:hypothetical protein
MTKSRMLRWARYVACTKEMKNAYKTLFGNPEGKRPLGRPRRRWNDNIKTDVREIGWKVRIGFMWLRIGNSAGSCEQVNESSVSIKGGKVLD